MARSPVDPPGDGDPRSSPVYTPEVIEEIQEKAQLARYRIRGFGTLRRKPLPSLDDLTFLPASLTRIPLEGYREKCVTATVLGTRYAEQPIHLEIPVMITGMSYGALSFNAKVALAKASTIVGSSTTSAARTGWSSRSGKAPSPARAASCSGRRCLRRSRASASCPRGWTSARPRATRTSSGPTT